MGASKSKLKAVAKKWEATNHPRYPKGHPMGGKFMPKEGSKVEAKGLERSYRSQNDYGQAAWDRAVELSRGASPKSHEKLILDRWAEEVGKEKVAKLRSEGLGKHEAIGFGAYIASGYSSINEVLRQSDDYLSQKPSSNSDATLAAYAISGFEKLPALNMEELESRYGDRIARENGEMVVSRHMRANMGLIDLVYSEGREIQERAFVSSTFLKDDDPAIEPFVGNVKFIIKPKNDTSGKWVDGYKNSLDEGEILFPPGTRFSVEKKTEEKEKYGTYLKIVLREI